MDASDYTYEEPSQGELKAMSEVPLPKGAKYTPPDSLAQEELEDVLLGLGQKYTYDEALSAINSLTLKQVMGLIPEKRPIPYSPTGHTEFQYKERVGFNQAIDQITQSAERIWKI